MVKICVDITHCDSRLGQGNRCYLVNVVSAFKINSVIYNLQIRLFIFQRCSYPWEIVISPPILTIEACSPGENGMLV